MKRNQCKSRMLHVCIAAAAMLLAIRASGDDDTFPTVHHSGDISFCSGGIGIDEVQTMKAQAANYPLAVTFITRVNNHDGYTAPEQVVIIKSDGTPVLDLKPDGPFLLVDLPPGKYQVSAGSAEQSRTQAVQIVRGAHKRLVFQLVSADTD
ncbi:MAG: putative exported protein [Nevskia sp.]|nr:putative exported protein [Nevskia sp.]